MNDLQRSAMEQALEALECVDLQSLVPDYGSGHYSVARSDGPQVKSAITALKAALAEPVQEPVLETVYETIIQWDEGGGKRSRRELARRIVALYTSPPQRSTAGATYSDIISDSGIDPR